MEFIMGGIIIFGGTFAPKDWAMCNGQLIAISQNQALFALLGNVYGGDGRTTFGIPDLRGRAPIGFGSGPGLPTYPEGRHVGSLTHTLNINELANHTHSGSLSDVTVTATMKTTDAEADSNEPSNSYLAISTGGHKVFSKTKTGAETLAADAISVAAAGGTVAVDATGNSQAFSIMQPSIAMNYIIAMQGLFPSRN